MTTERQTIEVAGISIEVVRKEIKNLHLGVYPPNGRVRVAAPHRYSDEAVRVAVSTRLPWIRKRKAEFARQCRQSEREIVTGESHYLFGRRFRLDVILCEGTPGIRLQSNALLQLICPPDADRAAREEILHRWYRARLRERISPMTIDWAPRVGVPVPKVRIRKMKTRWGSCNADARRVWINLELVKKPPDCLEFILVHEMVHLIERHHNDRFRALMDGLLPNWRIARAELNRAPLAHESWDYGCQRGSKSVLCAEYAVHQS